MHTIGAPRLVCDKQKYQRENSEKIFLHILLTQYHIICFILDLIGGHFMFSDSDIYIEKLRSLNKQTKTNMVLCTTQIYWGFILYLTFKVKSNGQKELWNQAHSSPPAFSTIPLLWHSSHRSHFYFWNGMSILLKAIPQL